MILRNLNYYLSNMFSTERLENGNKDSWSEAHLKILRTSIGSYLDLEVSTFVKIFEFYLVTQSL